MNGNRESTVRSWSWHTIVVNRPHPYRSSGSLSWCIAAGRKHRATDRPTRRVLGDSNTARLIEIRQR